MLFILVKFYIFLIRPVVEARAEVQQYFVPFLVQMKTLKFAFKIYWPLTIYIIGVNVQRKFITFLWFVIKVPNDKLFFSLYVLCLHNN